MKNIDPALVAAMSRNTAQSFNPNLVEAYFAGMPGVFLSNSSSNKSPSSKPLSRRRLGIKKKSQSNLSNQGLSSNFEKREGTLTESKIRPQNNKGSISKIKKAWNELHTRQSSKMNNSDVMLTSQNSSQQDDENVTKSNLEDGDDDEGYPVRDDDLAKDDSFEEDSVPICIKNASTVQAVASNSNPTSLSVEKLREEMGLYTRRQNFNHPILNTYTNQPKKVSEPIASGKSEKSTPLEKSIPLVPTSTPQNNDDRSESKLINKIKESAQELDSLSNLLKNPNNNLHLIDRCLQIKQKAEEYLQLLTKGAYKDQNKTQQRLSEVDQDLKPKVSEPPCYRNKPETILPHHENETYVKGLQGIIQGKLLSQPAQPQPIQISKQPAMSAEPQPRPLAHPPLKSPPNPPPSSLAASLTSPAELQAPISLSSHVGNVVGSLLHTINSREVLNTLAANLSIPTQDKPQPFFMPHFSPRLSYSCGKRSERDLRPGEGEKDSFEERAHLEVSSASTPASSLSNSRKFDEKWVEPKQTKVVSQKVSKIVIQEGGLAHQALFKKTSITKETEVLIAEVFPTSSDFKPTPPHKSIMIASPPSGVPGDYNVNQYTSKIEDSSATPVIRVLSQGTNLFASEDNLHRHKDSSTSQVISKEEVVSRFGVEDFSDTKEKDRTTHHIKNAVSSTPNIHFSATPHLISVEPALISDSHYTHREPSPRTLKKVIIRSEPVVAVHNISNLVFDDEDRVSSKVFSDLDDYTPTFNDRIKPSAGDEMRQSKHASITNQLIALENTERNLKEVELSSPPRRSLPENYSSICNKIDVENPMLINSPEPKVPVSTSIEDICAIAVPDQSLPSIDFSKLTNEDKSCAIGDFILENLIMEIFTCEIHLRDRMAESYKRILELREGRTTEEMSRYISKVFTLINESPEEQLDIYNRLNSPIVHSDLNRMLLASASIPIHEQQEIPPLAYESILNIQLYIRLEEELRDSEYLEKGMSGSEIEREHIFHKLIFDAINEKLDYERVGGLNGTLPSFFSRYKKPQLITPSECAFVLEDAKRQVILWAHEQNGVLPENFRGTLGREELLTDAIELAREDCLVKHLNGYIGDLEEKWSDYSDEIIEVLLGVSDYISDILVEGVVASLMSISRRKQTRALLEK